MKIYAVGFGGKLVECQMQEELREEEVYHVWLEAICGRISTAVPIEIHWKRGDGKTSVKDVGARLKYAGYRKVTTVPGGIDF